MELTKRKKNILIVDSTLRDGNHAVNHTLNQSQITEYAIAAEGAGIPIVVVGHGNGLGASSLQVGESLISDEQMLAAARKKLRSSKLGVYVMPGFATINKDLSKAAEAGVDVFCIGCHCTEADTTQKHIEFVTGIGKAAYGNLMMTHMVTTDILVQECKKMESYGARGVTLMDSAGAFLPHEVTGRISTLVTTLNIPVGFHAHNNLELAVANSLAAVSAGATILDATARGFGAGAGNAALEVLIAVLSKMEYSTGVDLYKMLDAADIAEQKLMKSLPATKSLNIISGLAGVFSGFVKHVERISTQFNVDPRDIFFELGNRKAVGGQEDMIVEVAMQLAKKDKKN